MGDGDERRTAAGQLLKDLYCPGCDQYSGGGICRVCQRGQGEFTPPLPAQTFVAVVCSRGRGCEVGSLPSVANADDAKASQQEALL